MNRKVNITEFPKPNRPYLEAIQAISWRLAITDEENCD